MEIAWFKHNDNWKEVKDACMTTIGKSTGAYPDSEWKCKLIRSEHSPIRKLKFSWKWKDLPYYVSVHLVRHKIGIEHFVSTQRTDRTGVDRENLPQGALVNHECEADAQACINISRKRLCSKADPKTREAWNLVKEEIKKECPELAHCMVRECVYRGFCPEISSCGYTETKEFKKELEVYRANVITDVPKKTILLVTSYLFPLDGDEFIRANIEFDLTFSRYRVTIAKINRLNHMDNIEISGASVSVTFVPHVEPVNIIIHNRVLDIITYENDDEDNPNYTNIVVCRLTLPPNFDTIKTTIYEQTQLVWTTNLCFDSCAVWYHEKLHVFVREGDHKLIHSIYDTNGNVETSYIETKWCAWSELLTVVYQDKIHLFVREKDTYKLQCYLYEEPEFMNLATPEIFMIPTSMDTFYKLRHALVADDKIYLYGQELTMVNTCTKMAVFNPNDGIDPSERVERVHKFANRYIIDSITYHDGKIYMIPREQYTSDDYKGDYMDGYCHIYDSDGITMWMVP